MLSATWAPSPSREVPLTGSRESPLDCVGIGIGPSNLSVAALLSRCPEVNALFFEQRPDLQWHQGLLVSGATLQTSFLKDLVTPVDPTHPCSFLNFLHEEGRLYQFINAAFPRVHRREFNEYLRWVSARLPTLRFGTKVLSVDWDGSLFHVALEHAPTLPARQVVVGVGVVPIVPECCRAYLGGAVCHAADFLSVSSDLHGRRVAVIGGGQTGAEVMLHLLQAPAGPPAELVWVSRRSNFLPLDESAFVNEMFTPAYADHFFRLDRADRDRLLAEYRYASDGISAETIQQIYRAIYQHRFVDASDLVIRLLPGRELIDLELSVLGEARLTVSDRGGDQTQLIEVDAVVLGTGFAPQTERVFSERLRGCLRREGEALAMNPDFSAQWRSGEPSRLYLVNAGRSTRGIADPNLSLLAWRAAQVVNGIAGRTVYPDLQRHSFVEWATDEARVQEPIA